MAQSPSFNPTVDPISFSPSPIVSGVSGKGQTMSMLSQLGGLSLEAIDAYNTQSSMSEIDTGIAKLNEEYLQQSPTYGQEVAQEAGQESLFLNKMPSMAGFESGEQIESTYSAVEKSMQEKLNFLDKAKSQGRISPDAYALRAKSIIKEVVSKNPHLTREALTRLSQGLSASGIQERMALDVDYDKAIQAQSDWELKQIDEGLTKIGRTILAYRDPVSGAIDRQSATRDLIRATENEFIRDAVVKEVQTNKVIDEARLTEIKQLGGIPRVMDVYRQDYWKAGATALSSSNDPDEINTALGFAIDSVSSSVEEGFSSLSYDADIRRSIDEVKKTGELVKSTLMKATTKEAKQQLLANITAINQASDTLNIRQYIPNLEAYKLQQQALTNPYLSEFVKKQDFEAVKNLVLNVTKQLSGLAVTQQDLSVNPDIGVSNATAFNVGQINSLADGNVDSTSVGAFNNHISSRSKVIASNESPQQRFIDAQQLMTELSDPKAASAAQVLSLEAKQEALTILQGQSVPLANSLKKLEDTGVTFGFNDEGLLTVTNTKASSKEIASFIDRTNTNLKAFANLTGMSPKNASKEYFSTFYGDVFESKSLPNVEQEYKEKARSLLPTVKGISLAKPKLDAFGNPIDSRLPGEVPTLTTPYALSPEVTRRPGFDITPLDYTKVGKEFDKEKDRFREEFLTKMLVKYNGNERKAYSAYVAGPEVVDKAINTSAKAGEPTLWAARLPANVSETLKKSNIKISDVSVALSEFVPKLRAKQEAIKNVNAQSYSEIFDRGSSVALAEDIQKDLASQGVIVSWNEVHQFMEQNNLMPVEANPKMQSGKIKTVEQQGQEAENIKRKYADLFAADKQSLANGTISKEEFGEKTSILNRKLKEELLSKGLK
jgi:hypothetical protein